MGEITSSLIKTHSITYTAKPLENGKYVTNCWEFGRWDPTGKYVTYCKNWENMNLKTSFLCN